MTSDRVHELSAQQARRIAVRAQLLSAPRQTELLDVIRHLWALQADMTRAVAPSADLVLRGRLAGYRTGDLDELIGRGSLIELRGMLRPAEDIALFTDEMAHWPGRGTLRPWQQDQADWVTANDECRRDVLAVLRADGPLPATDLPDTCAVPWRSTGWTDNKNLPRLLGFMALRGEVAIAGREGVIPLWDLAERVYPAHEPIPAREAQRIRSERQLASLGIDRPTGQVDPQQPVDLREVGEPAVVQGARGRWRVDPAYLDGPFRGRTVLLSPLDRLVFDRKRMGDLFGFDYQLEMYKPKAKRRWGYFALPILHGDRLVGKLDATSDHDAGVLVVHAVHRDEPFSDSLTRAVDREISGLAVMLGYDVQRADRA